MAKTFTQGYNEDQASETPVGDNLSGSEIVGFDPPTGSTSYGMMLDQIKTWLGSFFTDISYESQVDTNTTNITNNTNAIIANATNIAGKMDLVSPVVEDNALIQDANGNAKDAGLPLIPIQINKVTDIIQWYNNTSTAALHGLTNTPTMIHLEVKARTNIVDAGWVQGDKIEVAFGSIGNETVGSVLGITTTSSQFTLHHSSNGVAECFAIPNNLLGNLPPYMATEAEISLDITFVRIN